MADTEYDDQAQWLAGYYAGRKTAQSSPLLDFMLGLMVGAVLMAFFAWKMLGARL